MSAGRPVRSHLVDLPRPLPPPHARSAARLHIHLFGPLVATVDGAPVRRPSRFDTERLWLRLLLGGGAPTPRAVLAAELWPNLEPGPARTNVRFHLHHLHTALPPHDSAAPWILAGDDTLCWNANAHAWVDLYAWADALERAASLIEADVRKPAEAADHALLQTEAASALTLAIDLQTAELLPEHDGAWAAAWRDAAAAAYPAAVDRLVAHLVATKAFEAAVAAAARAVAFDPLDEAAHGRLMSVHAAAGNRTAALQAYARAVDVLRAELDAEPSENLAALALSLQHEPSTVPIGGAATDSPGAIASPAHGSAASTGAPARADRKAIAANLAGRASDVEQVCALVAAYRLVTVTGPAGVGKSAVAAAVAVAQEAAGRVTAWVDLAELNPPEALASTLEALRGDISVAPDAEYLVVLDNADRFAWPLGAMAPELLARDPAVRLLVTSRQPLALIGEARWLVLPFGPDADTTGRSGRGAGGAEPARDVFMGAWWGDADVVARTTPTPAQRSRIDAIIRAADGLPLGLVIAGRAARTLGLDTVAARMAEDPLSLLDPAAGDDRHRSLGAAIGWTLPLLGHDDVDWLRRLAAADEPLSAATVEAIAARDGDDAMAAIDALGRLIDAGWLLPAGGDAEGGEGAHRMLTTVRQFCREAVQASQAR